MAECRLQQTCPSKLFHRPPFIKCALKDGRPLKNPSPSRKQPDMNTQRLIITAAIVLTAITSWSPLCAQGPGRGPRVVSPDLNEGKVTFRLHAENAEAVRLTSPDIPGVERGNDMTKGEEGVWEAQVEVAPGYYRYRYDVDGVPVTDPRNPSSSESNSHAWSLVAVPGAKWMDAQKVPRGAVAEVTYHSSSLKRFRRMHVYTPPGYEKGEGDFPVFYLLHGAFDSDDSWTSVGRAGFILDNLIAVGKAKPMVVVMTAGHTGPFRFGGPRPEVDEFSQDFVNDVMPYIERALPRAHRSSEPGHGWDSLWAAHRRLTLAFPTLRSLVTWASTVQACLESSLTPIVPLQKGRPSKSVTKPCSRTTS